MKKNLIPVNEKIKADKVLLIRPDGEKDGLVSIEKALEEAKSISLDLVQVSPSDSEPVVCKLLDYGKLYFIDINVKISEVTELPEWQNCRSVQMSD